MNMDSGALEGGVTARIKTKDDIPSQNLFRRVFRKAESRGTVVNKSKTKILCVFDEQAYRAQCYLLDSDGNRLESGDMMKVLVFHLDSRPSVHVHVGALKLWMRDLMWVLRHLKLACFTERELAVVYTKGREIQMLQRNILIPFF